LRPGSLLQRHERQPPPPPPTAGERFVELLDPTQTIAIRAWFYGTTYDRNARFVPITTDTWPCEFYAANYAGNSMRPCSVRDYNLLVDGVLHASVTVPVGAMGGTITLRASELTDGWHLLRVVPASGTETSIPCAVYVRRGAVAPAQTWMYVQAASHDHLHAWQYRRTVYAKVPALFSPTQRALPRRTYPEFSTALPRGQLFAQDIVVHRPGDCYRTRLSQGPGLGAGILNAAQLQAYYWSYMTQKYPGAVALLDGPRGVGSVAMATHLQFGRLGGIYFTDSWRWGLISPDGTVQTIAGYRQQPPARLDVPVTATSSASSLELVGDWSAVPAERRGFHELWGLAFDERTIATDTAAAPIPNGTNPDGSVRMERPHVAPGPVAFLPDSQNNRIIRVQRSFDSHSTPAVVTEFITGLGDPWDVVCVDGVLYVSERTSHRIAAHDATTGAFMRVVVSGAALASMNTSIRRMQRNPGVSLADVRAQPCVAPEGLFHMDGWLYFGSLVQQQVRRVHLVTGALEVVVAEPYVDQGSNFFKLAVSAGTFGPAGTVFLCTFAGAGYGGRPAAYLPGGAQWDYGWIISGEGPGRVWDGIGYACAVAVGSGRISEDGAGRMAHASSQEGIWLVGRTQAGDGSWGWSRMQALERMWSEQGWHLTHGPGGWGYYGLPLPWGVSTDIDDYLRACGHVRP
jgi:hypothetical protein